MNHSLVSEVRYMNEIDFNAEVRKLNVEFYDYVVKQSILKNTTFTYYLLTMFGIKFDTYIELYDHIVKNKHMIPYWML